MGQRVFAQDTSIKGSVICALIEGAQVRYLLPYSPNLNSVELMWSKIKSELRGKQKVEESELIEATGLALKKVTRRDAQGRYQHCGYFFVILENAIDNDLHALSLYNVAKILGSVSFLLSSNFVFLSLL